MKLIIGLGNPGEKYESSRHNVGKWLVGQLTIKEPVCRTGRLNNSTILAQPTVFMNESGEFVKKLVDRHKIPLDDLLIIHDDLDIPLGDFRLQKGRGAAGHKGVESVIEVLGANDFWRLRIGIGRPPVGMEPEEYVLERFKEKELKEIETVIPAIIDGIKNWLERHD